MATDRTFNAMLNEYLAYPLLKAELEKRDYLLNKVEKDNNWKGGTLIVPFRGGQASSISFGSLTASDDVADSTYVRGEVSGYKEIWGTLKFDHRDIMEHDKVSEQNLLKILPDEIDDFMGYMKQAVSVNMLSGSSMATLTSNGASGSCVVDHPERFQIGMKISVDDDDTTAASGYVTAIDMNTNTLTVKDARSGGSAVDLSAFTTAQNAVVYHVGAQSNSFTSLKNQLLSSTNGGGSTLFGQTKTAYPYLQAINVSGASITAANILDEIFDAFTDVRKKCSGNPDTLLTSWKHMGSIMKALEIYKGAYNIKPGSEKTSVYGWMEIEVIGVKGALKIVAIQEMPDSEMFLIDWSAIKLHSNGFFKKRMNPETGNTFYEVRATTGYYYLVDICLYGELVVSRPSRCGVIHSISY